MRDLKRAVLVLVAVAVSVSCSIFKSGPPKPSREAAQAALQAEAEGLKKDGEKHMSGMGVTSIWTIEGVDLVEQTKDENRPWRGTVRFRIDSAMREPDGTVSKDSIKKKFDY